MMEKSSQESSDDEDLDIWAFKKTTANSNVVKTPQSELQVPSGHSGTSKIDLQDKFKKLQEMRIKMSVNVKRRQKFTDDKISAKKAKKAEKMNSSNDQKDTKEDKMSEAKQEWQEVKSFLNVNDHLHGPIKHGTVGPKTELEQTIDNALAEGDFEEAEILSDTLANREFAVKINTAFAAKRYSEEKACENIIKKKKQQKKLYWGFEAKNKWEMKGNM